MLRRYIVIGTVAALLLALPSAFIFPGFGGWLVGLVIPRDGYFEQKAEEVNAVIEEKFHYSQFIGVVEELKNIPDFDGDFSSLDFTLDLAGNEVEIGLSEPLTPIFNVVRVFSTGMMVLLIAFFNYRMIKGLFD